MFKCEKCNKSFDSHRKLNGHKSIHRVGGRYSVSRKKPQKIVNCLYCRSEFAFSKGTKNKFCCLSCSFKYQWEFIQKPKIQKGLGGNYRKYLVETRGELCEECGQTNTHNGKHLVLQLDHIDGDSDNNDPKNLRLLCPNCHTQTENFGSRGQGNRYKKISKRNSYLRNYKARLV